MLRKLRQWLAGSEIAALATDLEKATDQVQTHAHRIEGLQLRLERLSNRVNMRLNRAGYGRGVEEEADRELMEEMLGPRQSRDRDVFDH